MQRATKLFAFDERTGESPFVNRVWRTRSVPVDAFISIAATHWEIVVTRPHNGPPRLTVRGPETRATAAPIPQDAEFFGVEFKLGTFMPNLPTQALVDGALDLPHAGRRSFWLQGSAWTLPTYDNADVFVSHLVRKGVLVRDRVVESTLRGRLNEPSLRSVQRRVLRATGLTRIAIKQIERARKAAELLDDGTSILETVALLGYADQAHLSRSLKRFLGQTPRQIVNERD
jgi:hypothetical protein